MTTNNNQHARIPQATSDQLIQLSVLAQSIHRFMVVVGPAGCGKTAIATGPVIDALGIRDVRVWNFTGALPSDMRGVALPAQDGSRHLMQFAPELLPLREEVGGDPYVVVLDEFTDWDSCNQSLVQGLFAETPRIGVHELGGNGFFIFTGNRRGDGTKSAVLPAPTTNRGLVVQMKPDMSSWLRGAAVGFDSSVLPDLPKVGDVKGRRAVANSPVFAFLGFHERDANASEEILHPTLPTPWDGSPHPTERSWETAALLTAPNEDGTPCELVSNADHSDLLLLALQSTLGIEMAGKVFAFVRTVADILPVVKDIRSGMTVMPADPMKQYAVLHTATRILRKESGDTDQDRSASIAGGGADWFTDLFLEASEPEMARWAANLAVSLGIPMAEHPKGKQLLGLGLGM